MAYTGGAGLGARPAPARGIPRPGARPTGGAGLGPRPPRFGGGDTLTGVRPIGTPDRLQGPPRPVAPAPQKPPGPLVPNDPGFNLPAQQPSPLDSTYFANVAQHQFDVNNRLNALNQQSGNATTDLQNQLAQLSRQQPLDQLKADQGANSRGALFSTVLGQQLGNINQGYLTKQSGLQDSFTRGQAARDAEIQGLQGGVPLYDAGQYAAAADRAAAAAAANKALGESAAPLTPAPSRPPAPPPVAPGPRDTPTSVRPVGTPDRLTGTRNLARRLTTGGAGLAARSGRSTGRG